MQTTDQILIGVATTVQAKERITQKGKVKRPSIQFCRMADAAHKSGWQFEIFSPSDVSWGKERVWAWTPVLPDRPYGSWRRTWTRLPDVIYENVFVHLAMKGYATGLRTQAKLRGIPVFNPPLPGKWRLHRMLLHTSLKNYLPATEVLKDIRHAMRQIQQWRMAYVKPIGGYGGSGVTRIQFVEKDRYRVSWDRTSSGNIGSTRQEMSSARLEQWLRTKTKTPHLLQQGLHLLSVKGRKVDFRVVVHRDGHGDWKTVGVVPKLAAKDGVVTNLVAGGELLSVHQLIQLARAEHKEIPVEALQKCALDIASFVSARNSLMGLVGFDLGVDEQGRVWLIEMNPKPARSLLNDDMRKLAARYSVEFAGYTVRRRRQRLRE